MAVTIRFDGDPAGALDASSQVQDSLNDLGDHLGDAGDAGKDAGDVIGEGLDDVSDAAADAAEEVDEVTESSEGASVSVRSIGKSAKEAMEGDFSGAMSAATGFLRNFGPVGVIAGGLAAGGIGLATAAMDANEAKAAEQAEQAAKWAQAWMDAGSDVISSSQLVAGVMAIRDDPARYAEAEKNAENWGVTVSSAMRAMSGDATALEAAQKGLNDRQAEYNAFVEENFQLINFGNAATTEEVNRRAELFNSLQAGTDAYESLTGAMKAGQEQAKTTSTALKEIIDSADSASLEVDELGNQLYTLPDGAKIVIDADTGLASQNVETFKGDLDGIVETVNTKVNVDTSEAEAKIGKLSGKTISLTADVFYRNGKRVI